jgi:Holliday junction DNA helicase RuvA
MFAFLRGTVFRKPVGIIELDVNGAGYEVNVPDSVHRRVAIDQEVILLTHCHIREDCFQIFGFLTEEERALFRMLLAISGIGPKVALAVLSGLGTGDFARAVRDNDVTAFTKISGVGKKTGQRIILEMKAKMGQDAELDAILGKSEDLSAAPENDDVAAALCALGCSPQEAKRMAAQARKQLGEDARDEDLVREALRFLRKG